MDRQEIIDKFSRLYYDDPHTWGDTRWMGVPLMKYPTDMIVYSEIIFETRPDWIIETGTAFGGSALFFAHMLDIMGRGRVISIDAHNPKDHGIIKPVHPRITYFEGYVSVDPYLQKQVDLLTKDDTTMVVLDSDHSKRYVLCELENWCDWVSSGCYLVVEDTNLNSVQARPDYSPGPREALEKWLPNHPEFEVDEKCNRFLLTAHPRGFLRRK